MLGLAILQPNTPPSAYNRTFADCRNKAPSFARGFSRYGRRGVHFPSASGKLGVSRPVVRNPLLFVRPLPPFLPTVPLPCFAKAVPVSSTNKRFSSYLCSGHRREDRGEQTQEEKQPARHSVGVLSQALQSTLLCCVDLCILFLARVSTVNLHQPHAGSFCFPSRSGLIRSFPADGGRTSLLNLVIDPGFLPP